MENWPAQEVPRKNFEKTSKEALIHEQRQMLLMEKRHEMAVAGVRLEKIIFESKEEQITPELQTKIDDELSHIHPSMKPLYLKAIQKFFKEQKNASTFYTALLQESMGNISSNTSISPDKIGKHFFRLATGNLPIGKVSLTKEQGFILATFEQKEDLAQLSEDKSKEYVGLQRMEEVKIHKKIYRFSLIIALLDDEDCALEKIIDHEKQHNINHTILGGTRTDRWRPFTLLEPTRSLKHEIKGQERLQRASYFREIKDEVLAFIREVDSLENIKNTLNLNYHHLFLDFPSQEDPEKVKALTQKILEELSTIPLWNAGKQGRELLINLLYPISFEELPKWIPVIKRFYGKFMFSE